jgi:tRNA threonylcarbamoyladenosine biosynthesis protein TsaE
MTAQTTVSATEADTIEAGRLLGARLAPGTTVLLYGDLGAGKTAFVRGIAEGLGIEAVEVSSPTFTIVQEYRGPRFILQHVDLYRLSPAEVTDLALDDLLGEATIMAIEWAERLLLPPPAPVIRVTLAHQAAGRSITIEG